MIRSILLGLILLYLQIFKAGDWGLAGASINLLIPYAGFLGAYQNQKLAFPLLFFLGVGYDLMMPESLGLNTLLLLILCWFTIILSKSILEPKLITISAISFAYNFLYYLIFGLFFALQSDVTSFLIGKFIVSVAINTVYSIFIFYTLLVLAKLKISIDNVS